MNMKLLGLALGLVTSHSLADALDNVEQTEMVAAHNQYRSEAGVSLEVTWSEKLGNLAQAHANKLKTHPSCRLSHSHARDVGENLYWASALIYSTGETVVQRLTPEQVSNAWGSEREHYHYASNSCAIGKVCGHYTQMVWANTAEIGCAKAVCQDNSQVWVCNYYPAGNYVGEKPY